MNENKQKTWGTSYGEMVWHEFAKSKFTLCWMCFIILLFLFAIFAPFLANDKPFVIKIDGQWQWPMFKALTASDYSIFLASIVACVQLLLVLRNRKKVDPSIRSSVLWRQIFISIFIVFSGIILFYIFIPRRLDATDYKSMVVSGKATDAVFAPVPYGYGRTDLKVREQPPNREHWLGTDDVGSDVLCRLIHGSRISLSVGFVAVGISSIIGIIIGAILGYWGGKTDFIGMRSLFNIMLIIGLTTWTDDARFVRAEFFKLRRQDFVQSAVSLGLPLRSILFRHMLPNAIAPVLVNATFGIAGAIFIEAALSFLGFGVAPPTPSWGQILSLGVSTTGRFMWWLTLFPGLAIFFTVLAYNLVGEALRDAIDPRLRESA
jgi:peptide/nickel transport system permease protein